MFVSPLGRLGRPCVGGLLCCSLLLIPAAAGAELTLDTAEELALKADPAVVGARARGLALQEQAVADGQLPDPKLGIGVYNLPLDDFSLNREPTTQFRTGLHQAFPPGDTLRYQRKRTEWLGEAELAQAELTQREIRRDVRKTFLELYYQQEAAAVIEQSRDLFQPLVEITRAHFATGRVSQQDVLQAQLELSRLDERGTRIAGEIAEQRAELARWLGDAAWQPVQRAFPALPALPPLAEIKATLQHHPAIKIASARVQAKQQLVKVAREQYKPGWDVGLEYRKRFADEPDGSDLPDMMAATLTVDMPLFAGNRQDKRLVSSQHNAEAARQMREHRLLELHRVLETQYARWKRIGAQQTLYDKQLIAEASANSTAALHAYQSGVAEFDTLMRARLTELDVRLQELRLRVERAKAQIELLFLAADSDLGAASPEGVTP